MSWVMFFDGECAFCSASVRRVVNLDREGKIDLAPLQGKLATEMGFARYADLEAGTMVLLRESDARVFVRSDSLIELAGVLGGFWKCLTVFRFVPRPIRDCVYRWIARNRHRFVKGGTFCSMPDPEVVKRLRE